ncbi:Rad51/AAA domain containing protein, putative [Angomonas deanei]|uniref:DNA repair protein RAD51 homolog 3 n=1 Tax=Angomonas deanei TaxID=59799 RepID=A0A7G2C962_9TRYP|nr:Rad51/AAA domain containing protein, putative [Angomonas deanei]
MALLETCDFLSPSLKAKAQNVGLVRVDDLYKLIESNLPTEFRTYLQTQRHREPLTTDDPSLAEDNSNNHQNTTPAIPNKKELLEELFSKIKASIPEVHPRECEVLWDWFLSVFTDSRASPTTPLVFTSLAALADTPSAPLPRLTTFSKSLDTLLGGGIPLHTLTEVCGPPGVGKTQLLLQLCVSAALSPQLGGLDGGTLYIDTEGSVAGERLEEMGVAAVSLLHGLALREQARAALHDRKRGRSEASPSPPQTLLQTPTPSSSPVSSQTTKRPKKRRQKEHSSLPPSSPPLLSLPEYSQQLSVEQVMRNVHYLRVTEATALTSLVYGLPHLLQKLEREGGEPRQNIKLIIIDSIAMPLRAVPNAAGGTGRNTFQSAVSRNQLLFSLAHRLRTLAEERELTIVASNHVTTRLVTPTGGNPNNRVSLLIPALGDHWASGVHTRLLLSFHHYHYTESTKERGDSGGGAAPRPVGCREDTVLLQTVPAIDEEGNLLSSSQDKYRAIQHRVARLVKAPFGVWRSSSYADQECCFTITKKGVRDVPPPQ